MDQSLARREALRIFRIVLIVQLAFLGLSFVAALGMESEGGILSIHPFLLELVKRSLTALLEEEAKKQSKESDLLIKP